MWILRLGDLHRGAGGVVRDLRLYRVRAQEFFDLRQRLGMRARDAHAGKRRAGNAEEAVADPDDGLCHDRRTPVAA